MTANTDELEREIEASRSRIDATLNSLQDRFHPAAVADELIGIGRRSSVGSDFYNVALDSVRRNPVPVLLVCAGVALLVSSVKQGAHTRTGGEQPVPEGGLGTLPRRRHARIYPAHE